MALSFFRKDTKEAPAGQSAEVEAFLKGYSIEVMPRTAEKIEDFRALLPTGTRVYIAHIDGTPIEDMVATAQRIGDEGFTVMPHFPARIIHDKATLAAAAGNDHGAYGRHYAFPCLVPFMRYSESARMAGLLTPKSPRRSGSSLMSSMSSCSEPYSSTIFSATPSRTTDTRERVRRPSGVMTESSSRSS